MPMLVALVTLVVFARVRKHEFVLLDDNIHIHENPLTREPSWENIVRPWRAPFRASIFRSPIIFGPSKVS